nr:MAG TPA: hypothetical protein [Bacteriophage sp.]
MNRLYVNPAMRDQVFFPLIIKGTPTQSDSR